MINLIQVLPLRIIVVCLIVYLIKNLTIFLINFNFPNNYLTNNPNNNNNNNNNYKFNRTKI